MSGTSGTTFEPDTTTSRGMIVTVLYRLEGAPHSLRCLRLFTDVADGQYYADAVAWAAANNIVGGYGNGLFGPNDTITREQMAAILYRYAQYKGYDVTASTDLSRLLRRSPGQQLRPGSPPVGQRRGPGQRHQRHHPDPPAAPPPGPGRGDPHALLREYR